MTNPRFEWSSRKSLSDSPLLCNNLLLITTTTTQPTTQPPTPRLWRVASCHSAVMAVVVVVSLLCGVLHSSRGGFGGVLDG